jgi:hypothetical protein
MEDRMKKIIILFILLALSLFSFNCGGGSGSSNSPKGENPGEPSIVQLLPAQFVAQTNSIITLHAKVLDGNGAPVKNMPVSFTNLSSIGILNATTAQTNNAGIATVTLKSTTSGFSTVQAEINKGAGQVRDRKTMFFSAHSISQLRPTMTLTVDGFGDPYTLFEAGIGNDNEVTVTATVANAASVISGSIVTFASDRPYRVGTDPDAECSDESENCDVRFPAGIYAITNDFGEATVPVNVEPSALTSIETTLNIMAQADIGAFNMVTLFLNPVKVQNVTISANPQTVASGGTSTITAQVLTNAGTPAPDGTTVNFSVNPISRGSIEPFAQTTDGFAEAEFTAAAVTSNTNATIEARVGNASGDVDISITTGLQVVPASVTVASGTQTSITISGGSPPYTTVSNNPIAVYDTAPGDGIWTGSSITAHIGCKPTGAVSLTITDSAGATKTATINITDTIIISPTTTSICENDTTCSSGTDKRTFTISSGVGPYTVTSGNPGIILSPGLLAAGDNNFEVDAINDSITADTDVELTIKDACDVSSKAHVLVVNKP